MAQQSRSVQTISPQAKENLTECSWKGVNQPGCYVDVSSGDLYRIPQEALIEGSSPMIRRESNGSGKLVQLSTNPFLTTYEARMLACEHNVEPNF